MWSLTEGDQAALGFWGLGTGNNTTATLDMQTVNAVKSSQFYLTLNIFIVPKIVSVVRQLYLLGSLKFNSVRIRSCFGGRNGSLM